MSPIPCVGTFPFNTKISMTDATYFASVIRHWGIPVALSSKKIRQKLTEEEIIGFAQRNGLDASRDAA